ncbi:MAG: NAD(+) synthase [Syntrophomonadaceae bacterium]|nr:NAD(+) synthase [Syntrophomonadaceae bacterium]
MQAQAIVDYLKQWLREQVKNARAEGIVIGVSGGVDSSVAAAIAKQVFPDKSLGLILPCASVPEDEAHSRLLIENIGLDYKRVDLTPVFELFANLLETTVASDEKNKKALRANIKSRLRMITLYYTAQSHNYLVLGTGNKSEATVGYFTKYGDGGVDLQILGDLIKSEVYMLAEYLRVPEEIIKKAPSAGLWPGQTDESEMGVSYPELAKYILGEKVSEENFNLISSLAGMSHHKRTMPPIAKIPAEIRGL